MQTINDLSPNHLKALRILAHYDSIEIVIHPMGNEARVTCITLGIERRYSVRLMADNDVAIEAAILMGKLESAKHHELE